MQDSHVILICFAIDTPDSLDNVMEKWCIANTTLLDPPAHASLALFALQD